MLVPFVELLVLPVTSQQTQQANATEDATEHEARLALPFGVIQVDAVAEDGQIDDDAKDIADGAAGLVGLLQQHVVEQEGDDHQRCINEVISGFLGNHFSIRILASTATTFFGLPRSGLRSISAISGAAITKAATLAICSA